MIYITIIYTYNYYLYNYDLYNYCLHVTILYLTIIYLYITIIYITIIYITTGDITNINPFLISPTAKASLPLPQLSLELRGFANDVAAAKAVLRRAFPAPWRNQRGALGTLGATGRWDEKVGKWWENDVNGLVGSGNSSPKPWYNPESPRTEWMSIKDLCERWREHLQPGPEWTRSMHAMKSYTHRFSNPDGISEFRTLQTQQVQSGSRFPLLRDLIYHNNSLSATQSQMGSRRGEGKVVGGRLVMEFCRFKQNNNWGQIDLQICLCLVRHVI